MCFQKLEAALLTEQHNEVTVRSTPASFGVAIAIEQAVCDVQDPFLGFPPGPGRPCIRVLRLTLLHVQVTLACSLAARMLTPCLTHSAL